MKYKDFYKYAIKLYWSPFVIEGFDTLKEARAAAKKERKNGIKDDDLIIVRLNEYTGEVMKVLKA